MGGIGRFKSGVWEQQVMREIWFLKKCVIYNHISYKAPQGKSNRRKWPGLSTWQLILQDFIRLGFFWQTKTITMGFTIGQNAHMDNPCDHPLFIAYRLWACPEFFTAAASTQPGALKQVCPMFRYFLAEEPDSMKRLFIFKIRGSEACCDEQKSIPYWPKLTRDLSWRTMLTVLKWM